MPELAYLNGEYMPIEDAYIPIDDRGLLFGDSLYEVVRLYDGEFFRLKEHLDRMRRGAGEIGLDVPFEELREAMVELAERSGLKTAFVYAQVTRGVAPRGHAIPEGVEPTLIATVRPLEPLPEETYEEGVSAITLPDQRWARRDIKATTLLPNILDLTEAENQGCYDVLHYEDGGVVTEGSVRNVFALIDGVIRTHPTGHRILPGISRATVIECAQEKSMPLEERAFTVDEALEAEELFFADTYSEVISIVEVDNQSIGDGTPGPVAQELKKAFREKVYEEIRA